MSLKWRPISKVDIYFFPSLLGILAVTAVFYWPGIGGPLVLDDYSNLMSLGEFGGITNLDNLRQFIFGNISGPTGRPISMLSFLIDAQNWPADSSSLKYTNIMIHLMCGLAMCWLSYLLSQLMDLSKHASAQIALVVMAIWLVHPLNVSTTLYVIQRMTQLMTLFSMMALVFYLMGRRALEIHPNRALAFLCLSLFPFALLAVLSKENGVLLLVLIVLMELVLFRGRAITRYFTLWYRLGIALPLLFAASYLIWFAPDMLEPYNSRSFTMSERLLTETRVLSTYIWQIFFPDELTGMVFHDEFPISRSLFQPITTLLSFLFLLTIIVSAFSFRKKHAVFSFAVFWFFSTHLLESTYLPLEPYFEHRNYLGLFGPLFAVVWYLRLFYWGKAVNGMKVLFGAIIGVLCLLAISLTWQLATIWDDENTYFSNMAQRKPASKRAQIVYSEHLELTGRYEEALERIYIALYYHPDELTLLLKLWNFSCQYGLEQPVTLGEIAANPDLEYYGDNVSFDLGKLNNNMLYRRCSLPNRESVRNLYQRIGQLPMSEIRRSRYYIASSEMQLFFGDTELAIADLQSAIEVKPSVTVSMRQAVIAAARGNFTESLSFLHQARAIDKSRSFLLPSRIAEIESLELIVQERLNESR